MDLLCKSFYLKAYTQYCVGQWLYYCQKGVGALVLPAIRGLYVSRLQQDTFLGSQHHRNASVGTQSPPGVSRLL